MAEKYYVDACIWRDLHENRSDNFRPLGDWAFELFRMIRETRGKVMYSNLVVEELLIAYSEGEIEKLFDIVNDDGLLEKVEIGNEQIRETIKKSKERKLPYNDLLHAILARDNDTIMITRDKHFEEFQDIVEVRKPEELI